MYPGQVLHRRPRQPVCPPRSRSSTAEFDEEALAAVDDESARKAWRWRQPVATAGWRCSTLPTHPSTPQLSATGRIQPTRLPSAVLGPLQVCLWNGFCLRTSSQWCNWNKILISHGTNGSTRTYPVSTLWTSTKRRSRRRTASQRGRRGTGATDGRGRCNDQIDMITTPLNPASSFSLPRVR